MSTKTFVVFGLWIVALILFLVVGLTIEDGGPSFNLIGLGLAAAIAGFIIDKFWNEAA